MLTAFSLAVFFLEDYKSRVCGTRGLFHQSVRDLLYRVECVNTLVYDDVLSLQFFFKTILQFGDTMQFNNRQKQFQCTPSPKSEDTHVIIKESKDLLIFPQKRLFFSVGDLMEVFRSAISNHRQDTHTFWRPIYQNIWAF